MHKSERGDKEVDNIEKKMRAYAFKVKRLRSIASVTVSAIFSLTVILWLIWIFDASIQSSVLLRNIMLSLLISDGVIAVIYVISEFWLGTIENKLRELEESTSTIEDDSSGWYEYMVRASEHSQRDGDLWFRYLYKVIRDDVTKLSPEDVKLLLQNPVLTPFQKVTLQDALTEGTHTREHVLQANRKSEPKDLLAFLRNEKEYQEACDK